MNRLLKFTFSTSKNIGFVGTGLMGGPMATNLANKGYNVFAYDVMKDNLDKLQSNNIQKTQSLKEVAQNCNIIITMLPNSKIVSSVFETLVQDAKENTLIFDSSTIEPQVAQELNKKAKSLKLHYVDGPVSGGVNGAKNGTLTFMVGNEDKETLDKLRPVLESMGKNIFVCGSSGKGQIAKMCNNMALAIQMASISEAMYLGEKAGIDLKVLQQIMSTSTTKCWSLDVNNPVPKVLENTPASNNYAGGFGCSLMLKDLGIAKQTAENLGIKLPYMEKAHQSYSDCVKEGLGDRDFGVVFKRYQDNK